MIRAVRPSVVEVSSESPVASGGVLGVRSPWSVVAVLAAAATLGRLPLLPRSLSPDEGGLLMIAAQ